MQTAKHFCKILFYTCLFLIFTSCSKYTYIQNTPNVSFFKEKGQKEIQCHINYRSIQPQWAMSLTDKFAYQINGQIGVKGQSFGEVLGGYYLNKEKFYLEAHTGVGYGYLDYSNKSGINRDTDTINIRCDYFRFPLQLTIAIQDKSGSKLFLSNRVSYVNYLNYNVRYSSFHSDKEIGDGDYKLETTNTTNIGGWVWDLVVGLKIKKFVISVGTTLNWFDIQYNIEGLTLYHGNRNYHNSATKNEEINCAPLYLSFGYTFGFKKKETKVDIE
jgi:hypothetical protein